MGKRSEQTSKINMNVKMCSTSFVIRELQLKTISYPLAPTRMVESENTKNAKRWQGCGETGTLHCSLKCDMVQPLQKTVWWVLKELDSIDPAIMLLLTKMTGVQSCCSPHRMSMTETMNVAREEVFNWVLQPRRMGDKVSNP